MEEILNKYNDIFKMVGENLDDDVCIRNFSYEHYCRLNLSNEDSRKKKEAFDNKIKNYFDRINDINHQHDTDRDFQNFKYYLRELNEKLIKAGYNEVKSAEDFFNIKKELEKKNNARNQTQNEQNNNASRIKSVPSSVQNENNTSRSNSSRTNASRKSTPRTNTASSSASNGNQPNNITNQDTRKKSLIKRIFNYSNHKLRRVSVSKIIFMTLAAAAFLAFPVGISFIPIIPVKILFGEAKALKLAMFVQTALRVVGVLMLGRAITLSMKKESFVASVGKNIIDVVKESKKKRKEKVFEKKIIKKLRKVKNNNNYSRNVDYDITPDDLYQYNNGGSTNKNSSSNNTTTNLVTPEDLYESARNNPINRRRNTNTSTTNANSGVSNGQQTSRQNSSSAPINETQNTNADATNANHGVSNGQQTSTPNPSNSPRNRNARTVDGSTVNVSKKERLKQLREDIERIVSVIIKLELITQIPETREEAVANQIECYSKLHNKVSEMKQLLRETGKENDPEYTAFLHEIEKK